MKNMPATLLFAVIIAAFVGGFAGGMKFAAWSIPYLFGGLG